LAQAVLAEAAASSPRLAGMLPHRMRWLFELLAPPYPLATKHKVRVEFLVASLPVVWVYHALAASEHPSPKVAAAVAPLLLLVAIFVKDRLTSTFFLFDSPSVSNAVMLLFPAGGALEVAQVWVSSDPCKPVTMLAGPVFGALAIFCPMFDDSRIPLLTAAAVAIAGLPKLCLSRPLGQGHCLARPVATDVLFNIAVGAAVRVRLHMHSLAPLTAASLAQTAAQPHGRLPCTGSHRRPPTDVWHLLPCGALELSSQRQAGIAEYARSRKQVKNDLVVCRILFAHLNRPVNARWRLPAAVADCIRLFFQRRPALSFAQILSPGIADGNWHDEDKVSEVGAVSASRVSSFDTRTSMTSIQLTWRRLRGDLAM